MHTRSLVRIRVAAAEVHTQSLNEMVRRYRLHNDAASQRLGLDTRARAIGLLTEAIEILRGLKP